MIRQDLVIWGGSLAASSNQNISMRMTKREK